MIRRKAVTFVWAMAWVLALTSTIAISSPMPLGSLLGSKNATLDGQAPLPHTTLLEGDSLRVTDGLAMVTLDQGNRMVLGSQTQASFLREANAVTVSLTQGHVSLYHPRASSSFRIKAGDVTVSPANGYQTLGEVAVADGLLAVTAKDGALEVEKGGTTQEVANGKTITLATTAGRAPTPVPPKRHLKHFPFPGNPSNAHITAPTPLLVVSMLAAVGFGTAYLVDELTESDQPASPVTPGP